MQKQSLKKNEWRQRARKHQKAVDELSKEWKEHRQTNRKHPTLDFLFSYYNLKLNRLRLWSPGVGVICEGKHDPELLLGYYLQDGDTFYLDPDKYPLKRIKNFQWILELLEKSAQKTPVFNCYGIHEWCMIYQDEDSKRHEQLDLRVDSQTLSHFVEETPCQCTHFDAFRFFTKTAAPLALNDLSRDNQEDCEQSGCLHANMDLYKWAYKIFPFISGDLLLDTFKLAIQCRILDMKASPYDMKEFNMSPIPVETPAGREQYISEQHRLKKIADPIRHKLAQAFREAIEFMSAYKE